MSVPKETDDNRNTLIFCHGTYRSGSVFVTIPIQVQSCLAGTIQPKKRIKIWICQCNPDDPIRFRVCNAPAPMTSKNFLFNDQGDYDFTLLTKLLEGDSVTITDPLDRGDQEDLNWVKIKLYHPRIKRRFPP